MGTNSTPLFPPNKIKLFAIIFRGLGGMVVVVVSFLSQHPYISRVVLPLYFFYFIYWLYLRRSNIVDRLVRYVLDIVFLWQGKSKICFLCFLSSFLVPFFSTVFFIIIIKFCFMRMQTYPTTCSIWNINSKHVHLLINSRIKIAHQATRNFELI